MGVNPGAHYELSHKQSVLVNVRSYLCWGHLMYINHQSLDIMGKSDMKRSSSDESIDSIEESTDDDETSDGSDDEMASDNKNTHMCNICGEKFAHRSSLSRHRQSHKKRPVLLCLKCNKQYSRKDSFKNHSKIGLCVKKITKTSWECKRCDKTFGRKSSLTRHKKVHEKEDSKENEPIQSGEVCAKTVGRKSSRFGQVQVHEKEVPRENEPISSEKETVYEVVKSKRLTVQEIPQFTSGSDESEDESLLESVDEMEEMSFIGGDEIPGL